MYYVSGTLNDLQLEFRDLQQHHRSEKQQQEQPPKSYLQHTTIPSDYKLPEYYYTSDNYPTVDLPFMYFHQRKTGGSTIRSYIKYHFIDNEEDKNSNSTKPTTTTTTYIPCKTHKLNCETYYTPTYTEQKTQQIPTVYGGHLYYSSFLRTLRLNHLLITKTNANNKTITNKMVPNYNPPKPKFTCFTLFRERKLLLLLLFLCFVLSFFCLGVMTTVSLTHTKFIFHPPPQQQQQQL